jgi:lipopolysaccharide transport system permease protein
MPEKQRSSFPKMSKKRIKGLYLNRHILWDMAWKQLRARYAGSVLGIWLAIVNPLLLMLAITFVFTVILRLEMKDFALFALSGIFPWMFFSSALFEATFVFLNQQNVLRQFNLPREILPLSSVLVNFLNFLIGWCIVYPIFCLFNPRILLFFPLLITILLLHFFLVCGLGLIFSVFNVFFRDLGNILGVLLMFWFWVTPVFYSVEMIPENLRWIFNINPLVPYIVYYRDIIFRASLPSLPVFLAVFFWALLSLILGFGVFWRSESKILKVI